MDSQEAQALQAELTEIREFRKTSAYVMMMQIAEARVQDEIRRIVLHPPSGLDELPGRLHKMGELGGIEWVAGYFARREEYLADELKAYYDRLKEEENGP